MRLDDQRERELEKRKGLAGRTILGVIWFGLCFAAAYFLINYLFETEVFRYGWFYGQLFIPRTWPEWVIFAGLVLIVVLAINFFILVGYAFLSPAGKRRPGTPSMHSDDPDLDDHRYDYR